MLNEKKDLTLPEIFCILIWICSFIKDNIEQTVKYFG